MSCMSFSDWNLHFRYSPSICDFVYYTVFCWFGFFSSAFPINVIFLFNAFFLSLWKHINLTRIGIDHIDRVGVLTSKNHGSQNERGGGDDTRDTVVRTCWRLMMDLFLGRRTVIYSPVLRGMEIKLVLIL